MACAARTSVSRPQAAVCGCPSPHGPRIHVAERLRTAGTMGCRAQKRHRHLQQLREVVVAASASSARGAAPAAPKHVAVLGAGVIGLTSALRLLVEVPGIGSVTVIADKWAGETTSEGAGGLWKPYALGSTPGDDIVRWGQRTFDHYMELYRSEEAGAAGVILTSAYQLWRTPQPDPVWRDIVPHFRHLTEKEISTYDPSGLHTCGWGYMTVITEGRLYMAWLTEKLRAAGAELQTRHLNDVSELSGFDLVVNCTGLGAKQLWGDDSCYPVRGQVMRVRAPWIRHYINADTYAGGGAAGDAYIIPNSDTVVIGGTLQKDDWDTTVRESDSKGILARCSAAVPSLRRAEVVKTWVGLRPGRPSVRLEAEARSLPGGGQLSVVHNYGHGGSGLTLAWGCAGDVVGLVKAAAA